MKGKVNVLIAGVTTNLCTKMAKSVSASACNFCLYQPKEPKSLKK